MREVFCPQSRTKNVRPQKNVVLPQYSIPQKKNLVREVFCPQSRTKNVRPQKNFVLPQYSIPQKKKWIFKQSAAPTLATLAGAASGLRPLAARGLAGIIRK